METVKYIWIKNLLKQKVTLITKTAEMIKK